MPVGMKQLPYDQPGVGALNWGVTVDNAPSWVSKTRDALAKGITTGGNQTNYERLQRWADSPQNGAQNLDPTQRAQWNQFLKGGDYPQGLDPQIALHAVDWTLRDHARHDQHKTSLLQDIISSPITSIALGVLTGGASLPVTLASTAATSLLSGALQGALSPGKQPLAPDIVSAANGALTAKPGAAGAGIGGGPGAAGGALLGGTAQRPIDGMGFGGATRATKTKGAPTMANAPTLLGS